jgi:hypothetical protein
VAAAVIVIALLAFVVVRFRRGMALGDVKRSLADLKTLGTGIEGYAVEHGEYPATRSIAELASKLEPTYLGVMPRRDMWAHDYRYECWKENPNSKGCDAYAVLSAGADGVFQHVSARDYRETEIENFDEDLVYGRSGLPKSLGETGGDFIQWPKGMVR